MRNRGYIINSAYLKTGIDKCPQRSLTTRSWSLNFHFYFAHTKVSRLLGSVCNCVLGSKWGGLTGTFEPEHACATPGNHVTLLVRDSNNSIIERGVDKDNALGHILFYSLFGSCLSTLCSSHILHLLV